MVLTTEQLEIEQKATKDQATKLADYLWGVADKRLWSAGLDPTLTPDEHAEIVHEYQRFYNAIAAALLTKADTEAFPDNKRIKKETTKPYVIDNSKKLDVS